MIERTGLEALQLLKQRGHTQKAVAQMLGLSRTTVQKYWSIDPSGFDATIRRHRAKKLDQHQALVDELYKQHGNCDVVRQELEKRGIVASLRMLERHTEHIRQEAAADQRALLRIETPPGLYMQIDYGTKTVKIAGMCQTVKLFVAVLAYSRRVFVKVTPGERRVDWIAGIEGAFKYFNGIPRAIICDNAKPLVCHAAARGSNECELDDTFLQFCKYWDVQPIACYARYPEAKGKVERAVGYVKSNAIAGHVFDSIEDLERHIADWMATVADLRVMRLAPDEEPVPLKRFQVETLYLRKYIAKPPFVGVREEIRKVGSKGLIEVDGRSYQLPLIMVGKTVRIVIAGKCISVYQNGDLKLVLDKTLGEFKRTTTSGMDGNGLPTFGTTDPRFQREDHAADAGFARSLAAYQDVYDYCTQVGHA